MTEFLIEYKSITTLLHVMGMAVGVGAATVADVFFFRFLKNLRVSRQEASTINTLSGVIWAALIVAIATGLGLYLTDPGRYNETAKFLVKVVVVAIIFCNGLLLNFYLSRRLTNISFVHGPHAQLAKFRFTRRLAFASGAVSIVSWYTALILGASPRIPFSFAQVLLVYLALLGGAVIASQVLEMRYTARGDAASRP
jgi:hypothetical protein